MQVHICLLPNSSVLPPVVPCCVPVCDVYHTGMSISFDRRFEGNVMGWSGFHPKTQTIRVIKPATAAAYHAVIGAWIRARRGQGFYKTFGWCKILSVVKIRLRDVSDSECAAEGMPELTAAQLLHRFLLKPPLVTLSSTAYRIEFETRHCLY